MILATLCECEASVINSDGNKELESAHTGRWKKNKKVKGISIEKKESVHREKKNPRTTVSECVHRTQYHSPNPSSNLFQTFSIDFPNAFSLLAKSFIFLLNKLAKRRKKPRSADAVAWILRRKRRRREGDFEKNILQRKNHFTSCQTHQRMNSLRFLRLSMSRLSVSIEVESFS